MEFIRKIVDGEELKAFIQIPDSLINKKVELIILPIDDKNTKRKKTKSLSGILSKYANPHLIREESTAWSEEAKE